MVLGAMTHLALRVSDRPRSEVFYDRVLGLLGYRRTAQTDEFTLWWSPRAGAITISALPELSSTQVFSTLHHLAFNADSREQVDAFYQHLQTLGIPVLKAPARALHPETSAVTEPDSAGKESFEDSVTPSEGFPVVSAPEQGEYYAVLFKDPDGLCLELVYIG
ncbi:MULTISPECIES: VOC family protein [unclassified Leptolyngbya]|uniref:VOC family protein n=1 Tax=unclassified Leptolyngbya TaxID=2650499 RepID=UPI0016850A43|nr:MULTISPECIES: VOC family protein [unclassified Leptolyngbya]MBD1909960.1 VOC family protein [Leptolyngbya sp. FACHB-8]MBD2156767.1 VOC family protein [Leptolyngbya sp. FACHB-16]